MIDVKAVYDSVVKNTKISPYLTNEEIIDSGFTHVKDIVTSIDNKNFTCCKRRIVKIMESNIFYKKYTKEKIIEMIKKAGFTHIRNVDIHKFPYFFNGEFPSKDAVCIMLEGFTKHA